MIILAFHSYCAETRSETCKERTATWQGPSSPFQRMSLDVLFVGTLLNFKPASWTERSWCKVQRAIRELSDNETGVMINSKTRAKLVASPVASLGGSAGVGEFTQPEDRAVITPCWCKFSEASCWLSSSHVLGSAIKSCSTKAGWMPWKRVLGADVVKQKALSKRVLRVMLCREAQQRSCIAFLDCSADPTFQWRQPCATLAGAYLCFKRLQHRLVRRTTISKPAG